MAPASHVRPQDHRLAASTEQELVIPAHRDSTEFIKTTKAYFCHLSSVPDGLHLSEGINLTLLPLSFPLLLTLLLPNSVSFSSTCDLLLHRFLLRSLKLPSYLFIDWFLSEGIIHARNDGYLGFRLDFYPGPFSVCKVKSWYHLNVFLLTGPVILPILLFSHVISNVCEIALLHYLVKLILNILMDLAGIGVSSGLVIAVMSVEVLLVRNKAFTNGAAVLAHEFHLSFLIFKPLFLLFFALALLVLLDLLLAIFFELFRSSNAVLFLPL